MRGLLSGSESIFLLMCLSRSRWTYLLMMRLLTIFIQLSAVIIQSTCCQDFTWVMRLEMMSLAQVISFLFLANFITYLIIQLAYFPSLSRSMPISMFLLIFTMKSDSNLPSILIFSICRSSKRLLVSTKLSTSQYPYLLKTAH